MGEAIASGRSPARQQKNSDFLERMGAHFAPAAPQMTNTLVADNGSPASQRTLVSETGVRFFCTRRHYVL
jgi:hypothetical protein